MDSGSLYSDAYMLYHLYDSEVHLNYISTGLVCCCFICIIFILLVMSMTHCDKDMQWCGTT